MRILFLLVFAALAAVAQQSHQTDDPLRDSLFPPEAIMRHQQALGLTEDQKSALKNELRQAQARFSELQWTLEDAVERLAKLFKPSKVDEKAGSEQLDKVLSAEREIKRAQLMLLIRLKNSLTEAQQNQLRDLLSKAKP